MYDGTSFVTSLHFKTKHTIRGHLVHEPRNKKFKDRWFIYLINDNICNKQYCGSTTDMYSRWSNHKSDCNLKKNNCGLSTHFSMGCTGYNNPNQTHLLVTLLDYIDITEQQVKNAKHGGIGCCCKLCDKLKDLENIWIMRLGCFYFPVGLNSREEFKRTERVQY